MDSAAAMIFVVFEAFVFPSEATLVFFGSTRRLPPGLLKVEWVATDALLAGYNGNWSGSRLPMDFPPPNKVLIEVLSAEGILNGPSSVGESVKKRPATGEGSREVEKAQSSCVNCCRFQCVGFGNRGFRAR